MGEIWKTIDGYSGFYEISNHGRVRSWCGRNGVKRKNPRILSVNNSKGDYLSVNLYKSVPNTIRKTKRIHILVAIAFVPGWFEGSIVHHKDENKQNNHCSNLEWTTHRKNISLSKKRNLPTGVRKKKGENGYTTTIFYNGEYKSLGYYKTPEKASEVYQNAAKLIERGTFNYYEYKKKLDSEKLKKRGLPVGIIKRKHGYEVSIRFNKRLHYLGSYKDLKYAKIINKCARKLIKSNKFDPKKFRCQVGLE